METKRLSECEQGKSYLIFEVNIENIQIKKHLENLFIKKNERIILKRENYGRKAFIVSVLGINYAVGREICDKILVYYA